MKTPHTPGPWLSFKAGGVYSENGREIIFSAHNTRSGSAEEREANARLIAAAPELLEACRRALALIESLPYEPSSSPSTRAQDALVDAIIRATGEVAK